MMLAALRATAIAIAIAAFLDPVFTVDRAVPEPLVLVDMSASDVGPIEQALRSHSTAVEVRTADHRVPCAPGERCVIAADGSATATIPEDVQEALLIKLARGGGPNIAIQSATVSSAHAAAAGAARIVVNGYGVTGQTALRISDSGAVVGSATIEWKSETQTVDVPWWPIAAGPRLLRIEAATAPNEVATFDNAIDVGVDVAARRLPVFVFDARPSWQSTFVRRALEDDPRFAVEHRARVAPAISTSTPQARLDAGVLDATSVLIVGAPDALTAGDVALIDRFVRVRGGTAILLPERIPAGAAASLFHGEWRDQLVAQPAVLGPLRATELLRPGALGIGAVPLAPLVIATPAGDGRIIVSGAMDAWRYRDADAAAFDRFWTTVAADGARLAARLRVEFGEPIGQPGGRMPFTVRYRSMRAPASIEASAIARCAGRAQNVRLWPAGSLQTLHGEVAIPAAATCTVEVAVNDVRVVRGFAIAAAPSRPIAETFAGLERAVHASGGVVTDEDDIGVRLRSVGASARSAFAKATARQAAVESVHPMRSPFWILPFAGLLSIEWWLRRRKGLR